MMHENDIARWAFLSLVDHCNSRIGCTGCIFYNEKTGCMFGSGEIPELWKLPGEV